MIAFQTPVILQETDFYDGRQVIQVLDRDGRPSQETVAAPAPAPSLEKEEDTLLQEISYTPAGFIQQEYAVEILLSFQACADQSEFIWNGQPVSFDQLVMDQDGQYVLEFTIRNFQGAVLEEGSRMFYKDTQAPVIEAASTIRILDPAVLEWSVQDPHLSSVSIWVDGILQDAQSPIVLSRENQKVFIEARDTYGHVSTKEIVILPIYLPQWTLEDSCLFLNSLQDWIGGSVLLETDGFTRLIPIAKDMEPILLESGSWKISLLHPSGLQTLLTALEVFENPVLESGSQQDLPPAQQAPTLDLSPSVSEENSDLWQLETGMETDSFMEPALEIPKLQLSVFIDGHIQDLQEGLRLETDQTCLIQAENGVLESAAYYAASLETPFATLQEAMEASPMDSYRLEALARDLNGQSIQAAWDVSSSMSHALHYEAFGKEHSLTMNLNTNGDLELESSRMPLQPGFIVTESQKSLDSVNHQETLRLYFNQDPEDIHVYVNSLLLENPLWQVDELDRPYISLKAQRGEMEIRLVQREQSLDEAWSTSFTVGFQNPFACFVWLQALAALGCGLYFRLQKGKERKQQ